MSSIRKTFLMAEADDVISSDVQNHSRFVFDNL